MAVETSVKRSSLPVLIPLGAHAKNPHIKLTRPVYVIGSKSNCRIKLVSSTVSSTHALLVQTRHITYLRDLCSRTHIFVNGQQVKEAILHDGDLIALGRFTFKYQGPKKDHGSEPIVGPAALEVAGAPLPVPIEERVTVIGRRQSCDIPLLEQSVSTVHAVILQWEGKRFVRDLWSRCGTFVNGKQIHEQELNPRDLIRVGETDITFAPSTEEASFSVVEGASDSIAGGLPAAQEVDLGLEVEPKHSADEAPLELILTPKSPPKHDEMLPLDAEEAAVATPHDTAHIPLNLQAQQTPVSKVGEDIELEPLPMTSAEHEPAEHHAAAVEPSSEQLDLSRRGWRAPAAEEAPAASTEPEIVAPKFETLAPIAVDTDDAIAQSLPDHIAASESPEPLVHVDAPIEPPAPILPPAPEIMESTEPTLESAMPVIAAATTGLESAGSSELTDTTFGRSLEELSGTTSGPIIETPEQPEQLTVAETASASEPPQHAAIDSEAQPEAAEPELSFPLIGEDQGATIDASANVSVSTVEHTPVEPIVLEPLAADSDTLEPDLSSLAEPTLAGDIEDSPAVEEPPLQPAVAEEVSHVPAPDQTHAAEIPLPDDEPVLALKDDAIFEPPAPMAEALLIETPPMQSIESPAVDDVSPGEEIVPHEIVETIAETPALESVDVGDELPTPAPAVEEEPTAAVDVPQAVGEVAAAEPANEIPSQAVIDEEISTSPAAAEWSAEPEIPADVQELSPLPEELPQSMTTDWSAGEQMPAIDRAGEIPIAADETEAPLQLGAAMDESVTLPIIEPADTVVEGTSEQIAQPVEGSAVDASAVEELSDEPDVAIEPVEEVAIDTPQSKEVTIEESTVAESSVEFPSSYQLDAHESNEAAIETPPALDAIAQESAEVSLDEVPESPAMISPDDTAFAVVAPKVDEPAGPEIPEATEPAVQAAVIAEPVMALQSFAAPDVTPAEDSEPEISDSSETIEEPTLSGLAALSEAAVAARAFQGPAEKLDLSRLAPQMEAIKPLDESAALDLIDNDPVEESSAPRHATIDQSSLESIPGDQALAESSQESSVESSAAVLSGATLSPVEVPPLIVDAHEGDHVQVEAPSPTDVPATASPFEAPLDLSQLSPADESARPLDESAALDLLNIDDAADHPAAPEAPSFDAGGQATIDQSVIEPPTVEDQITLVPQVDVAPPPVADVAAENIEQAPPAITEPPVEADESEYLTAADLEHGSTAQSLMHGAAGISEEPIVAPPDAPLEFGGPIESPVIQMPPENRRRAHRPRVIRNAFGQDPFTPKPSGPIEIPPFAANAAKGLGATLNGLSQPPVKETDVFGEIARQVPGARGGAFDEPPPSEADIFAQGLAKMMPGTSETDMPAVAGNAVTLPDAPQAQMQRPRLSGGLRGGRPPGMPPGPRPVVAFTDPDAANAAAHRHRTLLRRALVLMVAMLVLIGGAWAGIFAFVPKQSKVQAILNFKNFAALTQREQRIFEADQLNRLGQEATRNVAVRMLQNRHPSTPPGFLIKPDAYANLVSNPETHWPDSPVGQFVLRYDGTDPDNDKDRIEAVALAMYDSNAQLATDTRNLKMQLADLSARIDTAKQRIDDYKQKEETERAIFDARPTKEQINKLTADDADFNAEYNDAIHKAKDAQADLAQLQEQQKQAAATTAPADPVAADAQIQQMTRDAQALTDRLTDARKERAALADRARATLDSAYDEFKKQVDSSQSLTKDNPQLAAYVNSAQSLQQAIRDLTDESIKRQQDEYNALNNLKSQIEGKVTQRKADLLSNDPKLKQLTDEREIETRKLNTARDSGMDKEASDIQNDLKLIDTAIKAEQEIVSNDPVYNDMITGLAQMIEQKQHSIDEERKKTDDKLAELKQSFNRNRPTVENMPADQKELASSMQQKLIDIDAARRQYAEAVDASTTDSDASIQRMNNDLQAMQTNIELRKKQVLAASNDADRKVQDQQRATAITAKIKEVNDLNTQLTTARAAYETNHTNLLKATSAAQEAEAGADRLDQAIKDRDQLERQLEQNERDWDQKKAQVDAAVEPVEPSESDARSLGVIDDRAKYGFYASGGLFIFFAGWILITLLGAARQSQFAYTPAIESLETNLSPHPGKPETAEAEENEPAVA